MKKVFCYFLMLFLFFGKIYAEDVKWFDGKHPISYVLDTPVDKVVMQAVRMFNSDIQMVTGIAPEEGKSVKGLATIHIIQWNKATERQQRQWRKMDIDNEVLYKQDGFILGVRKGQLFAVGNNGRGTAYALLELSRKAGVSPWIWWGDQIPQRRNLLTIDEAYTQAEAPTVERRGLFINDEDWSTSLWSSKTFEPEDEQEQARHPRQRRIGAQTYQKIFELLLRLRGNMIWPAMHEVSVPFYEVEGAKEMADRMGIMVGTSHCEPMMRNSATEWKKQNLGAYNYLTNKENIQQYWITRLQEVQTYENVYTIGMRGVHDGQMEGPKTLDEHTFWLQQVINDERELLRKYVHSDLTKVPQVFVPYKEVLNIYENGLVVPDDVMLMWCDDNYGYLTRLSDEQQQRRSGGGGIYYHLSYWGRPHDYLWMTTTQPGLIYNEMMEAYRHHARKEWIVNVHDPKSAGYQLEFFLDMAWNIHIVQGNTIEQHLQQWLCREFGESIGKRLLPVMREFYRLTSIRRPEFMGWNQVELDKKKYARGMSSVQDTEFNMDAFGHEMDLYLQQYGDIMKEVEDIGKMIPQEQQAAYMGAVKYRVLGAGLMAVKQLEAQRARRYAERFGKEDVFVKNAEALSLKAYHDILELTRSYQEMKGGKWRYILSCAPRELLVFQAPTLPDTLSNDSIDAYLKLDTDQVRFEVDLDGAQVRQACDYDHASVEVSPVQLLGHSMNAVPLPKDAYLEYTFDIEKEGDYLLHVALIPTQPNDKGDLRFQITVDGVGEQVFSLKEPFRSEQWKRNVLRQQAVRKMPLRLSKGRHVVRVKALDAHVVVDQLLLDPDIQRQFYVFPIK